MTALKSATTIELEDILFSEAEIAKVVEVRDHIFEFKNGGEPLGYISLYDLKTITAQSESTLELAQIRQIDGSDWTLLFQHPFFQRRKPQLVPASTLEAENEFTYFILKQGQKSGPFEKHELLSMVDNKEILLIDMVSTNAGHTWMKLYQVDGFDRRNLKISDQLPGLPFNGVFDKITVSPNENDAETDALSGLAYIGNVKRGKVIEREKISNYEEEKSKNSGNNSIYKWLLILSAIGIAYFLYNIKNQLSSPFSPEKSPIGEQAEMLTPTESFSGSNMVGERPSPGQPSNQFNDTRRSGKFETRSFQPIRPNQRKSFMETGKYQAIKNSDGDNDANYFYDNTSPIELDPVRSQISRETSEAPVLIGEPTSSESGDVLFEEQLSR
jgi:hypothetical protein